MSEFWWREALCAELGSDLFFEMGTAEARRACRMCSARLDCLTWVLENPSDEGIWGGFGSTIRDRMTIRVNRGEDARTVAAEYIDNDNRKKRKAA